VSTPAEPEHLNVEALLATLTPEQVKCLSEVLNSTAAGFRDLKLVLDQATTRLTLLAEVVDKLVDTGEGGTLPVSPALAQQPQYAGSGPPYAHPVVIPPPAADNGEPDVV
jgi:hypothetical protein